ncbi:MAG: hypothetical protein NVV68_05245 [Dokdonella sp.]|nr:hypothetical protein [Dokdonella sp.]
MTSTTPTITAASTAWPSAAATRGRDQQEADQRVGELREQACQRMPARRGRQHIAADARAAPYRFGFGQAVRRRAVRRGDGRIGVTRVERGADRVAVQRMPRDVRHGAGRCGGARATAVRRGQGEPGHAADDRRRSASGR